MLTDYCLAVELLAMQWYYQKVLRIKLSRQANDPFFKVLRDEASRSTISDQHVQNNTVPLENPLCPATVKVFESEICL